MSKAFPFLHLPSRSVLSHGQSLLQNGTQHRRLSKLCPQWYIHGIYAQEIITLQECSEYLASHRLKQRAAGRPVVMVPLILYTDDTSGNKSKKWHCFNSWSVLLAGLPREMNTQLNLLQSSYLAGERGYHGV